MYLLAVASAALGLVVSLGVAFHEWQYGRDHPYRPGVSSVLVALALAAAAGCLAAFLNAWKHYRDQDREADMREIERLRDALIRPRAEGEPEQAKLADRRNEVGN